MTVTEGCMIGLSAYLDEINKRYEDFPLYRKENLYYNAELIQATLGLSSEVGEFQNLLLKQFMYNRKTDIADLTYELGDVLHYLLRVAHLLHISPAVLMERNLHKLHIRDCVNGTTLNKEPRPGVEL